MNQRKLYVGLISLGTVLALFYLYVKLNRTPQIKLDMPESNDVFEAGTGTNEAAASEEKVGAIGDVEVRQVEKAHYIHLDENKKIDREFGFEKVLHKAENQWELEKPYFNMFKSRYKISITGDRGTINVESSVAGGPNPLDAAMEDNVILHVLPVDANEMFEMHIYLDDVTFISERSLFTTAGPVNVVSEDFQLKGTGMEMIYDRVTDILDYFKVNKLDWLKIKTQKGISQDKSAEPSTQKTKNETANEAEVSSRRYTCVLNNNVRIENSENVIRAEMILLNNITMRQDSGNETDTHQSTDANEQQVSVRPEDTETGEITVRCNGSIVISPIGTETFEQDAARTLKITEEMFDKEKTTLVAQSIAYDAASGDVTAQGPAAVRFYTDTVIDPNHQNIPVTVTAQKDIIYRPDRKRITIRGDSKCTMERTNDQFKQTYHLSGPVFVLDMNDAETSEFEISHFTASGGPVRIASVRSKDGNELGGIELKCTLFEYDEQDGMFTTDAGMIKLDNSKSNNQVRDRQISLQRKCFAFLRNFSSFQYSIKTNRIFARGFDETPIRLDYIPLENNKTERQIIATAYVVVADLMQKQNAEAELKSLWASGGVTYEEKKEDQEQLEQSPVEFIGSEFIYDANDTLITAMGDELQQCIFNGAMVNNIRYNLSTGEVKFDILAPASLD